MLTLFPHPFAAPHACLGRRCDPLFTPLFSTRPLSRFGVFDAFRDLDEEMERLERAFFDEEMPETLPEPEQPEEPQAAADDDGRIEQVSAPWTATNASPGTQASPLAPIPAGPAPFS